MKKLLLGLVLLLFTQTAWARTVVCEGEGLTFSFDLNRERVLISEGEFRVSAMERRGRSGENYLFFGSAKELRLLDWRQREFSYDGEAYFWLKYNRHEDSYEMNMHVEDLNNGGYIVFPELMSSDCRKNF